MKFPRINEQDCPPTDGSSAPSSTGGSEGSCPGGGDTRCNDPAFAAANPILCGASVSLVLKPSALFKCTAVDPFTFTAFARNSAGEVAVSTGVTFSSSNSSVLSVDGSTGLATVVGAGVATVSATWQGLTAFAKVTVLDADTNCCDEVCVQTAIAQDNSKSMGEAFGAPGPATKGDAARTLATAYVKGLQSKDSDAVISFNEAAILQQVLSNDEPTVEAALSTFPSSTEFKTSLTSGIQEALSLLGEAPDCGTVRQQVILLISDGADQPPMGSADLTDLLTSTDQFKDGGGIIICIGVRASGDGYTLLQRLSSGGYFLNVVPDNFISDLSTLGSILCYFCGGGIAQDDYGLLCLGGEIGEQKPDPDRQLDVEVGASIFTSTRQACASCPGGTSQTPSNLVPKMSGYTSPSGQASASSEYLHSGHQPPFGANGPAWGAFIADLGGGWAADVGITAAWLKYKFPSAKTLTAYAIRAEEGTHAPYTWTFEGSNDDSSWTTLDTQTAMTFANLETKTFSIPTAAAYQYYRLNITAANPAITTGSWAYGIEVGRLKLIGVAGTVCATATEESFISQADADSKAQASAQAKANAMLDCPGNTEGDKIVFNNGQMASATPYPSQKTAASGSGGITKVTVKLKNVRKQLTSPWGLLLVAPDGTKVLLSWITSSTTRPLQGADITFDDAAGGVIPTSGSGVIPTGSYQCTVQSPGATTNFPAPAPAQPYNVTLAAFNGIANKGAGVWKLYAIHVNFYSIWIPPNEISDGWTLTIT